MENDNRCLLRIAGLSAAEIRGEAYMLIMAEENGPRRLAIIMGRQEAQAIASEIEGIKPERPYTQDLFVSFAHAFGVKLVSMLISRFDDGVFYAELTFRDSDGRSVTMDARTSDAIAIAVRTQTPIYASTQVMDAASFVIPEEEKTDLEEQSPAAEEETKAPEQEHRSSGYHAEARPENYSIEELERTLNRLIEEEDYEEAARINEILRRKRSES